MRFKLRMGLVLAMAMMAGMFSSGHGETRLGVSWSPTYGFPPSKAEVFMPQVRKLGAGFSRITLYWSQLEPREGRDRWVDLDAYVNQLSSPEEGMITIASASPWATRSHAWVFPSSPALDSEKYYAFVKRVVEHVKGRVRVFQDETEPNNSFFWSGTAGEYAAQHKVFYKAVKDADPNAVVVLAGSDGLFDPTGADPFPGQEANLAFLKTILADVHGEFDLFDLHLYGDAYIIPARIETVREAMRAAGGEKPVMVAEYHGPSFFEFKANRRWFGDLQGPGASADSVRRLRSEAASLPVETRMFLLPDDPEMAARLLRLQSEDLVVRNVFALSSGVLRTAYFDVWQNAEDRDAPNAVLYGAIGLLDHDESGALQREKPLAPVFRRLAAALAGETGVRRLPLPEHADAYAFRVERKDRSPLLVAWRRPAQPGGMSEPLSITVPWKEHAVRGVAIDGGATGFRSRGGSLTVSITDMPVLID